MAQNFFIPSRPTETWPKPSFVHPVSGVGRLQRHRTSAESGAVASRLRRASARPAEEEPPHRTADAIPPTPTPVARRWPPNSGLRPPSRRHGLRLPPVRSLTFGLPVSLDPRLSPHRRPSASLALPDTIGGRPTLDKWTAPPCTLPGQVADTGELFFSPICRSVDGYGFLPF